MLTPHLGVTKVTTKCPNLLCVGSIVVEASKSPYTQRIIVDKDLQTLNHSDQTIFKPYLDIWFDNHP